MGARARLGDFRIGAAIVLVRSKAVKRSVAVTRNDNARDPETRMRALIKEWGHRATLAPGYPGTRLAADELNF